MIVNLYVSIDLAIAIFALAVGLFTSFKAYKIDEASKNTSIEQRYELEKSFYLVSTVGWMTMATRILAIPIFWLTVVSLIPAVPGAMCEFGVFQAGSPFSWADFGVKFATMIAFGGWLFFDFMNRKLKGSPLIGSLSRWFVLLFPLLIVDILLDVSFFGLLKPLVVPCCMVAYPITSASLFSIGCPFCFVTYKFPLLWGVIATYGISVALLMWSFLFQRSHSTKTWSNEIQPILKKTTQIAIILSVIGTILLIVQALIGPFSST